MPEIVSSILIPAFHGVNTIATVGIFFILWRMDRKMIEYGQRFLALEREVFEASDATPQRRWNDRGYNRGG